MAQIIDRAKADVTLADAESTTLEVETGVRSEDIIILIDDGTGSAPATYDLLTEVDGRGGGEYQQYDVVTEQTAFSWADPAIGKATRYTLTNQSGGSADYRVTILVQDNATPR